VIFIEGRTKVGDESKFFLCYSCNGGINQYLWCPFAAVGLCGINHLEV